MIVTRFDSRQFMRDMKGVIDYSVGFLDGAQSGKTRFLQIMGEETKKFLAEFIDANARVNPDSLHHVYEWYQTGSAEARLFEINYTVSNLGLSLKSTFSQSTSIKSGSRKPFYDKASIMEAGVSVKIRPKSSSVLAFEEDGQQIFTKNPVTVDNPGGTAVAGSFESMFDSFFSNYFTQSFLRVSGILDHLKSPMVYKKDLPAGKRGGRGKGLSTGFRWIANVRTNR
jgi:hypothetical protein